jgi:hypothetical protein
MFFSAKGGHVNPNVCFVVKMKQSHICSSDARLLDIYGMLLAVFLAITINLSLLNNTCTYGSDALRRNKETLRQLGLFL